MPGTRRPTMATTMQALLRRPLMRKKARVMMMQQWYSRRRWSRSQKVSLGGHHRRRGLRGGLCGRALRRSSNIGASESLTEAGGSRRANKLRPQVTYRATP